jgi:hypothetical protein
MRVDPNEFFQAGPLATEVLGEGLTIQVRFQTLDLIPACSDELHGFLGVTVLSCVPGPRRYFNEDEERSLSAPFDLGGHHGWVLTVDVDVGPYSTTAKENLPPPTRDMRQRHEPTEIINRRVKSSNRKFEYRGKYFRVKMVNRSYFTPLAVDQSATVYTNSLVCGPRLGHHESIAGG